MAKSSKPPALDISAEVAAASKALQPAVKRLAKSLKDFDPAARPPGAAVDALYDLRQLVKVLASLTAPFDDVLAPAAKVLEEHFIATLAADQSTGVQGARARVQVTTSAVPQVSDWPKFYAYIKRTGSFELLGRGLSRQAITERWEAKKEIPGMGRFLSKKVSCTKLGGKG